jgi:hypothetical protein
MCQRLAAVMMALWLTSTAQAQYFRDDGTECRSCHVDSKRATDFCELFEAGIYEKDDKHVKAFELLHDSDSKRALVKQILGFDLREAFADDGYTRLKTPTNDETRQQVAEVKACLRCHATWPKDAGGSDPQLPPVNLKLGVSCQACHGPGFKWSVVHHFDPPAWRVVTPEAKASIGFYDVRSPVKKAQLCASCHVGNIEQEKFVKHEWYAGGHPPLPSFELASFEWQMPAHWKPLAAKKDFQYRHGTFPREDAIVAEALGVLKREGIPLEALKSNYVEANFQSPEAENNLPRSRDAIVAGATVLETYVRLVGEYSAQAAENKAVWPELALYDCTACHHELRSGLGLNARPKRNHTPGRPPLAAWPTVLAKLAAHQAVGFDQAQAISRWAGIEVQILQLERAATQRPFGDAQAMRTAGAELGNSLHQLAIDAANSRFDQGAARNAIVFLSEPGNYETRDFFAARQAAWAIREVWRDLNYQEAENQLFQNAIGPLALELPSGQARSVMQNLHRWLPAAADYDPAWFHSELKAVRARLGPQ